MYFYHIHAFLPAHLRSSPTFSFSLTFNLWIPLCVWQIFAGMELALERGWCTRCYITEKNWCSFALSQQSNSYLTKGGTSCPFPLLFSGTLSSLSLHWLAHVITHKKMLMHMCVQISLCVQKTLFLWMYLWYLALSSHLFFHKDPWVLRKEVWYKCLI